MNAVPRAECVFTLFPTAIGTCGIAWSARGLLAVQLPEADVLRTTARLRRRVTALASLQSECALETAPPHIQRIADAIAALFAPVATAASDARFEFVELDDADVPAAYRAIYACVRAIPPGQTRTYGEIARAVGNGTIARAVGQAMGRNPWPIVVPCHRVLGSDGSLTGFSARGGIATKRRMLALEGVRLPHTGSLFDDEEVQR